MLASREIGVGRGSRERRGSDQGTLHGKGMDISTHPC